MDISSLPKVSVTFQSKPLSQRYFDQHPEIHHLYPSSADFKDKIYGPALDKALKFSLDQVIEISEGVVRVNGQLFTY
jgi:hypothetical protein